MLLLRSSKEQGSPNKGLTVGIDKSHCKTKRIKGEMKKMKTLEMKYAYISDNRLHGLMENGSYIKTSDIENLEQTENEIIVKTKNSTYKILGITKIDK
jgi:hypothetical protein